LFLVRPRRKRINQVRDNQQPSPMAHAKYVATVAVDLPTHLARPPTDQGRLVGAASIFATVTSADRSNGPGAQERDVHATHRNGIQGDRSRISVRLPARFRLRNGTSSGKRPDPEDVTIQVLTQCREDLIPPDLRIGHWARRAIIHFYNSISTLQRRVVFGLDKAGIKRSDGRRGVCRPRSRCRRRTSSSTSTRPRVSPVPSLTTRRGLQPRSSR